MNTARLFLHIFLILIPFFCHAEEGPVARQKKQLLSEAHTYPCYCLNPDQLVEFELLQLGTFAPLKGYLCQADYQSVLETQHLKNGSVAPVPIVLRIPKTAFEKTYVNTKKITLVDPQSNILGLVNVTDVFQGASTSQVCVGGSIDFISSPQHFDFLDLRLSAEKIKTLQDKTQIGCFIEGFLHPYHKEFFEKHAEGKRIILFTPLDTNSIDDVNRIRCLRSLLHYFPSNPIQLVILPKSSIAYGKQQPSFFTWMMNNCGCSEHYLDFSSNDFPSQEEKNTVLPYLFINHSTDPDRLFPEVEYNLLQQQNKKQGICIYFTGLSGSGKSTLAQGLIAKLQERDLGDKTVTLLDGDEVRHHLSKGLGFSKEDRSLNVQRIGYVASLIVKHGGIALCANIAPYAADREANRERISQFGKYIEVHVKTSLDVCEQRDIKGLYQAAREGKIKHFTGVSDPYEEPSHPEITIDTNEDLSKTLDELLRKIEPYFFSINLIYSNKT